jgi:CHRD domain
MKKLVLAVAIVSLGAVALIATAIAKNGGGDNGNGRHFSAKLTGFEEVAGNQVGAVSTDGRGRFSARLEGNALRYRLSYEGLEGGNVLVAHIHFGQLHTIGGISVFLCGDQTPGNGIPDTCPLFGTVEGVLTGADMQNLTGQGLVKDEFDELVRAMRKGVTYANVHTQSFLGGEIRGQIDGGRHFGDFRGKNKDDD